MLPGVGPLSFLNPTGGGGITIPSSAASSGTVGPQSIGDFNFQPKGGGFPPAVMIALAVAAALVGIAYFTRRGR